MNSLVTRADGLHFVAVTVRNDALRLSDFAERTRLGFVTADSQHARAGARFLRQLNPRQQAGPMTGRGEACSKRHKHLHRGLSRRLHTSGPPKPPFTSFEDQPRIVSEHGKRCEKLGISHTVESNGKCFSLSPTRPYG